MKKMLTVLVVMALFLGVMPWAAFAAPTEEKQPITVEKAIEISKGFFPVSKGLDQFDSTYEQNEYNDVWSLRWYNDKGDGELNVRVDAITGEIAGFNIYSPADYTGKFSSIPKVSRTQGEKIVREFIKKAAPSKFGQLVLKPNNETYYGNGPVFHNYSFNRIINGIEYPGNNIHVEVNGQTGQVRSFYSNWETIDTPPLAAKLTREEAEKIFAEKFGFKLKYFRPQANGKTGKPIMPIYEINNPYEVTIDALNGEIIQDGYYGPFYDKGMGGNEMAKSSDKSPLEPFEQQVADELKDLISREKALEIAAKAVAVPANYQLNSSSLNKDWNFSELRIWSFQWSLEEEGRYGWASAEIDAKTGKVLSFDFNESDGKGQPENRPLKIKTKAQAEKLVQDFLKAGYPEVVGNLRVQEENMIIRPLDVSVEENQGRYYFRYERLVNGIPFGQNYVNATVDSYTGKISSFQMRFLDLEFPKTENVIEKSQITDAFLANNQMILVYTKDQERNLRLVYKLAPVESYRFDAVSGQMIDYNGEPVLDKKVADITDIGGHWAEQDIKTLNQMGLLHYEKGIFQPNAQITQAELMKALVKSTNNYLNDSTEGNWYEPYYRQAKQSGLITEKEIAPQAALTREQVAKFIARNIVNDKIAQLNIYQVPFKDEAKISQGYQGYVAIANGLGIITGDGSNFNPQAKVKKGEACVMLVRYLKTEK